MKKKKLIGKLSLQKSRISALNSSKIVGGAHTDVSLCGAATNCFCITRPGGGVCGSISDCDVNCTLTVETGSECQCL